MSLTQHRDAELEGYGKPIFLQIVGRLNTLLANKRTALNGHALDEIVSEMTSYLDKERIQTSDGYGWFWGLKFHVGDVAIVIAIPWSREQEKTDGSHTDRSIALYCTGGAGSNLDSVATSFANLLEKYLSEH